jgi:hypothetical protein
MKTKKKNPGRIEPMVSIDRPWGIVLVWDKTWNSFNLCSSQLVASQEEANDKIQKMTTPSKEGYFGTEYYTMIVKEFKY